MPRTRVELRNGDVIELTVEGEAVVLSATRWQQRLSREEAWELAEALDAVATRADEEDR